MAVELAVLGVPSSAGAHHAGQDLAPGRCVSEGLSNGCAPTDSRLWMLGT